MKIILSLLLLLAQSAIYGQDCPRANFLYEPGFSTDCNETGHVSIGLSICPSSNWSLQSVEWTIQSITNNSIPTTIVTSLPHLDTYITVSDEYQLSAIAYFVDADGLDCSTNVSDPSVNGTCAAGNPLFINFWVNTLQSSLDYSMSGGSSGSLVYSMTGIAAFAPVYTLTIDGIQVPLPPGFPSPSTINLSGLSVGNHCAELSYAIQHRTLCTHVETVCFDILPDPVTSDVCETCYTLRLRPFSPTSSTPNSGKYVVSAWVKVPGANPLPQTYYAGVGPFVTISYTGSAVTENFYPSGPIIDGWQRISGEFVVPGISGLTHIHFKLQNTGSPAYFDDIRIHPFNATMKSYVHDPSTFWMTSELDDNNYATFYEYDREGQLIRIKKETEKGIYTIQEQRSYTKGDQ